MAKKQPTQTVKRRVSDALDSLISKDKPSDRPTGKDEKTDEKKKR